MSNSDTDFLSFLSENDPLGLLKTAKPQKPKAKRSVLLNNFEEIVNFFEEYNREPCDSPTDIKEFQLYHRLKAIRSNAEMAKEAAKKAVREDLEKKGANLHEQLDKALGF